MLGVSNSKAWETSFTAFIVLGIGEDWFSDIVRNEKLYSGSHTHLGVTLASDMRIRTSAGTVLTYILGSRQCALTRTK